MKIIKENLFNRILRPRHIQFQRRKTLAAADRIWKADALLNSLSHCTSLLKLVDLHKTMWADGFRNSNIGPCEYGMFRTKDIMEMKPSEVYLGDIYGLWTFSVPEWENRKNALLGENWHGINPGITVYQIVLDQYRRLLESNLSALVAPDRQWQHDYFVVNGSQKE